MQLQLKTHGQPVGKDPYRQFLRGERVLNRREEDRATLVELVFADGGDRPVVVDTVGKHEFQLVAWGQQFQVLPVVACAFTRAGSLEVDNPRDARIDFSNTS